jgi:prepilin-type N-terminal cleavage/methylation domain-containing protein
MSGVRRGFTLIEMLAVIVVVMLLALLLAPTVRKLRRASWRARCAANLKQLHVASMNYAQSGSAPGAASSEGWNYETEIWNKSATAWVDWRFYESHEDDLDESSPNADDFKTFWYGEDAITCIERGSLWNETGDARIYVCPAFLSRVRHGEVSDAAHRDARRSYVMNSRVGGASFFSMEALSRTALFLDGAYEAANGATWGLQDEEGVGATDPDTQKSGRCWYRGMDGMLQLPQERLGELHDGFGQVIFCDGHTELVTADQTEAVCSGNWGD